MSHYSQSTNVKIEAMEQTVKCQARSPHALDIGRKKERSLGTGKCYTEPQKQAISCVVAHSYLM